MVVREPWTRRNAYQQAPVEHSVVIEDERPGLRVKSLGRMSSDVHSGVSHFVGLSHL